jgi:hypothetical protein
MARSNDYKVLTTHEVVYFGGCMTTRTDKSGGAAAAAGAVMNNGARLFSIFCPRRSTLVMSDEVVDEVQILEQEDEVARERARPGRPGGGFRVSPDI